MADADQLAARAFRRAEYDFSQLMDLPESLMSRADRHGVRLLIAPTFALPDAALDAVLSWRLGQYLLTRFYDPQVVADQGLVREDVGGLHAADVHGLAIGRFTPLIEKLQVHSKLQAVVAAARLGIIEL